MKTSLLLICIVLAGCAPQAWMGPGYGPEHYRAEPPDLSVDTTRPALAVLTCMRGELLEQAWSPCGVPRFEVVARSGGADMMFINSTQYLAGMAYGVDGAAGSRISVHVRELKHAICDPPKKFADALNACK